ncbi:hypothetical protein [Streptomyces sp. MJP52]|uniref:hypothetical protein n=1 Tax=Streptomyces sp. MJP52 TaxID=2940555 RepID=UPI002476A51A|nr:hypothetical protein [Streptomyces sp. MJP52]MDH6228952.1 hypothetical protein [Streptomyces sp. MJP52]
MIAKAAERGSRTYGLLAYLYGPGRANEHTDPHLVAAWSPFLEEPARSADAKLGLLRLADFLDQPVHALDGKAPAKHVYHVPVRVAPQDRRLTDDRTHEAARTTGNLRKFPALALSTRTGSGPDFCGVSTLRDR